VETAFHFQTQTDILAQEIIIQILEGDQLVEIEFIKYPHPMTMELWKLIRA
jgi:hypothetical protein